MRLFPTALCGVLSVSLAVAASSATALSCMRPDVARTFGFAAEAEETYVVLLGRFAFVTPDLSDRDPVMPQAISVPAQFQGQYLGAADFQDAPELSVILVFDCVASWCGNPPEGNPEVLAFVEQSTDGFTLRLDPCGSLAFFEPTAQDIAQTEACMRGEDCTPALR